MKPKNIYRGAEMAGRIKEIAAEYTSRETNGKSLITVTTVDLTERMDHATVFITVMPEKEEANALDFLKRKRSDMRSYIKKRLPVARIPHIEVEVDEGQKLAEVMTKIEIQERENIANK